MKYTYDNSLREVLPTLMPAAAGVGVVVGMLLLPGFAAADSWIDDVIQAAKDGNGTYVETSASASSGGQTAGSGESITTGDSSASSRVETHINANSDGESTVYVKTETSVNGETETKEYAETYEAGEPVKVNVSASATDTGSHVEVRGWDPKKKEVVTIEGSASSTEAGSELGGESLVEIEAESAVIKAMKAVPSFFKKLFGFFWGF